jgi:Helix-turn-helix domain
MKKSADRRTIAPVDVAQRYTIAEAVSYLRISHASIYKEINARRIRVLKHGKRTYVPGSEIARLSRLEDTQDAPLSRETAAPAKPEPSITTSYRLLDSRIHQTLMRDIARQQALWDVIQKFDVKLQHLLALVEKLSEMRHGARSGLRKVRPHPSSSD